MDEQTAVARQWPSSDHVGILTDANETEELCFLYGPFLVVKNRASLEFSLPPVWRRDRIPVP
jgi:hypothetical protein